MTAATSTPFTALGGLVLVGVMFRMVLVLVENEVVVVMVALVVMMVLAGFIKPSYKLRGTTCIVSDQLAILEVLSLTPATNQPMVSLFW